MIRSLAASLALLAAGTVPAAAATYAADTAHSQARFTVVHLAFTKVHGTIPIQSATIETGSGDVPTAVSATLDLTKIDTQEARRDDDLRSPNWFEVAKYPTMTFVSKKIAGTPQQFSITGDLTFHGVTKPVTLAASYEGTITDARGRKHVAYTATTTVDRRDWGLTWGNTTPGGQLVAAYDVTIDLEVDAVAK